MTGRRKALIATALAVLLVSVVFGLRVKKPVDQPIADVDAEPCDSCDARHQNLLRLRDTRELNTGEKE